MSYDVNTIPLLLLRPANESCGHSGVVLVNNASIGSRDHGSLVRALIRLYDMEKEAVWKDRLIFRQPPSWMAVVHTNRTESACVFNNQQSREHGIGVIVAAEGADYAGIDWRQDRFGAPNRWRES